MLINFSHGFHVHEENIVFVHKAYLTGMYPCKIPTACMYIVITILQVLLSKLSAASYLPKYYFGVVVN
jgi:hypothetical protein